MSGGVLKSFLKHSGEIFLTRNTSFAFRLVSSGECWLVAVGVTLGTPFRAIFPRQESSRFRLASQIPPGKFSVTVCLNRCWSKKRRDSQGYVHTDCASLSKNIAETIIMLRYYCITFSRRLGTAYINCFSYVLFYIILFTWCHKTK